MSDVDELVRCITALLALNERNVLVPHGVPGLARDCLKSAAAELERMRDDSTALRARLAEVEGALREVISVSDRKTDIYDRAKAALASAGEGVVATTADYERWLGDLLAIIHRDGGEYLSLHGPKKAVADAHLVWAKLQLAADPTPPPPTGEAQDDE